MTPKIINSEKNSKNFLLSIVLLSLVFILLILTTISITRAFLYFLFGYSVYLLMIAGLFFGLMWFFGKKTTLGWKKNILLISFIVSLICLFHISFFRAGITDNPYNYILPQENTVGGIVISAFTYPLYLIYPNYGSMIAISFVGTGLLLLFLLFPLIKKIDKKYCTEDHPAKKIKKNNKTREIQGSKLEGTITKNPLPTSTNVSGEPPLGSLQKEDIEDRVLDANTLLFGDNGENVRERSFGGLLDKNADRAEESARILFSEEENNKDKDIPNNYSLLDKEWSNDKLNSLYTNKGRKELLEEKKEDSQQEGLYGPYSLTGKYPFDQKGKEFQQDLNIAPKGISEDIFRSEKIPQNIKEDFHVDKLDNLENVPVKKSTFNEKEALTELQKPLTFEESGFYETLKNEKNSNNPPKECTISNNDKKDSLNSNLENKFGVKTKGEYSSQISIETINLDSQNQQEFKINPAKKYNEEEHQKTDIIQAEQTSIFDKKLLGNINNFKYKPYKRPSIELLKSYKGNDIDFPEDFYEVKQKIETTMAEFEVPAEVIGAKRGPTFTLYELKLGPGYQIAKIRSLKENLVMRLAIEQIRILAPIQGKDAFGLELPNKKRDIVGLQSLIGSAEFSNNDKGIRLCFGKTLDGTNFIEDLSLMPHLLVAGATGTGKSVFLNSLIVSILYKYSPEDVRLVLIDPKRVELAVYKNLPNLLIAETIKENSQAVNSLKWLTEEMDRRYKFFEEVGCANIDQYNNLIRDAKTDPKMYRIVLIIDEMADLMMKGKGQVETYVVRIAQLARACGIHMIIATQRPTVQVITGLIKANILSRVAFSVKSSTDSRVILDDMGAEDLLGNGDMIYSSTKGTTRMQGALVELDEIKKVCDYIRANNDSIFNDDLYNAITIKPEIEDPEVNSTDGKDDKADDFEDMLKQVLLHFIKKGKASISSAQATFGLGFLRAKKFVDALEARGYLGPETTGSQGRSILITEEEYSARFE